MDATYLSRDEATAALDRCVFEADGRRIVHCVSGGMGADWDRDDARLAIVGAPEIDGIVQIAWIDTVYGRCLGVGRPNGKVYIFDTVTP